DRNYNQDRSSIIDFPESRLLVLADGMGGRKGGEMASQQMVDTATELLQLEIRPIQHVRQFFLEAINTTHLTIVDHAHSMGYEQIPGTTCVLVLLQGNRIYWAHAGDSRFYLIRDRNIHLRTRDHSYVEYLRSRKGLSEAEAKKHPERNRITRCIGYRKEIPQIEFGGPMNIKTGDQLLLCTDGLWGSLDDREIIAHMEEKTSLQQRLEALADLSERGCRPHCDNITAIALEVEETAPTAVRTPSARDEKIEGSRIGKSEMKTALDNIYDVIKTYEQEIKKKK
ncbi:MAG: serine/threonine-protein phosphatase, partial [Gammaproteobacteria bacterium]|nr:serine/threonine-protein phosphatase [Gammaproteobacteria bacterium]